ncbi:MAG: HNH endonuclease [Bacteroidota bacterium]
MEEKECFHCKIIKPLADFYNRRGYYSRCCKKCDCARATNSRKIKCSIDPEYRENLKLKTYAIRKRLRIEYGQCTQFERYGGKNNVLTLYKRDKKTCQNCGATEKIVIHHIDGKGRHSIKKGVPINNDINNLIILCPTCHRWAHNGKISL